MFDPSSRALLRQAPDLPGLTPETLDELLTAAHIELATVRLLSREGEPEAISDVLDQVRRLASTFEAYVALDLRPEQTRATAFVAASAHQILSRVRETAMDRPTVVSSDAIGSSISATLLFLIAGRAADAAEVASQLRAKGERRAVRRSLILSLRELATGNLTTLIERDLGEDTIATRDSREVATDLLLRECAYVVQGLGQEALGSAVPDIDIRSRLKRVLHLSEASAVEINAALEGKVHHQFAGPHHLATLLSRLIDGVQAAMLIRLPAPSGARPKAWSDWLLSQTQSRPFLWINHLKAIGTGYLNRGRSMVMTSPTGSGKTTLSVLKIAATLCAGESVVYLAPTHALVDQVETDLSAQIGDLEVVSIVEDVALEELGEKLPPFSVMTPERCLALLGFAPELFDKVGLLVFDEFHLISADDPATSLKISTRAIDSMLALLTFLRHRKEADLLLLSAMVADGAEIARWLRSVTGREVEAFDDPWKPTRQLRSCVIYDRSDVHKAVQSASKAKTQSARSRIPVQPLGLFSLISGWHPKRPEKLVIQALTDQRPPLLKNAKGKLTSNRNEVAAWIAADYAAIGKRVIVFCNDSKACGSVADQINALIAPATIVLDETQEEMRKSVIRDVGAAEATFDPIGCRAAVHHGDLLPLERRLTESVFRVRRDMESADLGLDVVAATSTIAQGLNLPCDVVILAGTDRSTIDDPGGNPRTDLRPHEILNALGRAGRAAYAATGLAIVVPATPICVEIDNLSLPPDGILKTIFSEQDACENVYDPIELLLDRIETSANSDPKVQSIIRRLSVVSTEGESGFDDIVCRSLGFFRRRETNALGADKWLEHRRIALKTAEEQLEDPIVLDWQREIAIRNGVPPKLIERLVEAFDTAPVEKTATEHWISWLLDIVADHPLDLTIFVRQAALESVFGRSYTNTTKPKATSKRILGALKTLVSMWCSGRTLIEIEDWLLAFIREHEGEVKQQANQSTKAQRARRFAIRIAPDIGFLCGVLGQIAAYKAAEQGVPMSPVIEMLPQMVRAGDYDRHHMALRQMTKIASRVGTFETHISLRDSFKAGASAEMDVVREEVQAAILLQAFTDLDEEE
ncbi:DEAD/DEAH box helicase [Escherichia coli]|uniref:DEAD/DEAH box helicase n=1 Tax=Escherichia coli TaxID=562 RepID=UPI000CFCB074|nr:DEAD/DEAH box helicase [Escherichia coli]EHA4061502.1 DEAD/DEAH box helicase [Escherichia coli]EHF3865005.1 DEAD/DEAH box helicase [Escherichia coli]ELR8622713.1 DEAD/DEAH box helicase [Escherichia coli]MDY7969757.1 DEAD/DEAH box helicase [Escherichia coli]MDY7981135.1 DEAD/DEAH box helicase [Escherichia coli]